MSKKTILIILISVLSVMVAQISIAAEIHVTTTQDNVPGSLRAAITTANTNGEDDIIRLPAGVYFLSGEAGEDANSGGDLDIDTGQKIIITGADPRTTIINGNDLDRALHILNGTVSISCVTMRRGKPMHLWQGGGIYNNGYLTLIRCVVESNSTVDSLDPGDMCGGGIYNNGSLVLTNCTVSDNTTGNGGDDYYSDGGNGGDGGGIYNNHLLTLTNCTISNNKTGNGGYGGECGGNGGNGGGILNAPGGSAFITSCTIGSNSTGEGGYTDDPMCRYGGEYGSGGGICNDYDGIVRIKNTIIADNGGRGPDCCGTLTSQGYNLIENTEYCTITGIQTGNITGIDPLLGPLDYHGGPSKTRALLPGSPAIDAGYSPGIYNDQRGFVRPYDIQEIPDVKDGSDIGAYEYGSSLSYHNISGKITYNGVGLRGVTLVFSNNGGTTTTGTNGNYSHSVSYDWSGTVTPKKTGYTFIPTGRTYNFVTVDQADQDYTAEPVTPPHISLSRTQLNFGTDTAGKQTPSQIFLISNSGGGTLNWITTADADWLSCNPASGTGSAVVAVSININPPGLLPGTYTGTITVADPHAVNSPQTVNITLTVYDSGSTNLPFGSFDTPIDGAVVTGSIPVTGWAIDNIGIENVEIYRNPVTGEGGGLVYIGDAIFVEGARPDIETIYPDYPNCYRAGWGYLLLTNTLPEQGNGTFTLYVKAADKEGNIVTLGTKTITCDNAHAVKPFGTIDTPAQGGTATGSSFVNFGWALTPLPNTIPKNGSTITIWVDGLPLGHPVYNQYRADIAALFPGYNNSDGAVGYYYLDTTKYKNGVHTIAWSVKDNAGNMDGIGSRYFSIQNTGATMDKAEAVDQGSGVRDRRGASPWAPVFNRYGPVRVKKGFNADIEAEEIYADEEGVTHIEIRELERLEIHLSDIGAEVEKEGKDNSKFKIQNSKFYAGYLAIDNELRLLPIGSTFNTATGTFYWQPGVGFIGQYRLVFIEKAGIGPVNREEVVVTIVPKFPGTGR